MSLLRQAAADRQNRAVSRNVVRKGGENVTQQVDRTREDLTVTVGGVTYPVFVLGLHDIDSTAPEYYVP